MLKKVTLLGIVVIISVTVFFYREEFFALLQVFEKEKMEMPFFVASMIIFLKTLAAPLGFPGAPLTLLTGSLFGKLYGTVISIIGNTLGASLAFLLSRYVFYDYVQTKLLKKYPKIKKYEERLEKRGFSTVIALRLIPLFPFNALNFLFGVTNISFKTYFIGSFIGMIPGTFMYVYFGESLRMLNPISIIMALLGLGILIYLGRFYEKRF